MDLSSFLNKSPLILYTKKKHEKCVITKLVMVFRNYYKQSLTPYHHRDLFYHFCGLFWWYPYGMGRWIQLLMKIVCDCCISNFLHLSFRYVRYEALLKTFWRRIPSDNWMDWVCRWQHIFTILHKRSKTVEMWLKKNNFFTFS